jgi:hypothetical protein
MQQERLCSRCTVNLIYLLIYYHPAFCLRVISPSFLHRPIFGDNTRWDWANYEDVSALVSEF